MPDRIRAIGATAVAIEHSHALAVASLPSIHRDPFDRLLIAQGTALSATILTADAVLTKYPAETLLIPSTGK